MPWSTGMCENGACPAETEMSATHYGSLLLLVEKKQEQ